MISPGPECIEVNTEYVGNNIGDVISDVDSWWRCQFHCKDDSACLFWTYKTSAKECWLKNSDAGRVIGLDQRTITSGTKHCGGMKLLLIHTFNKAGRYFAISQWKGI